MLARTKGKALTVLLIVRIYNIKTIAVSDRHLTYRKIVQTAYLRYLYQQYHCLNMRVI